MVRIYLFGKYIRYFHRIVMSLRTDMAREINCYGQFGGLYYQNHNVNSISIYSKTTKCEIGISLLRRDLKFSRTVIF